jgi:3-methyladenine DNA glycosylase AlkC
MEQIALDMGTLLAKQFPEAAARSNELRDGGLVLKMRKGGQILLEEIGLEAAVNVVGQASDSVRGWGAMAIGAAPAIALTKRLELIRPFADDPHFAVREWAWLSLRAHVVAELSSAIGYLTDWTSESSPRLRRFTVEVTRPRGVWSSHIPTLKVRPELGEPLLEPLRADEARYVQDSVANWINDASHTAPKWALSLCERWLRTPSPATERICHRALRTLRRERPAPPTSQLH